MSLMHEIDWVEEIGKISDKFERGIMDLTLEELYALLHITKIYISTLEDERGDLDE